jgi:hypothetical protein
MLRVSALNSRRNLMRKFGIMVIALALLVTGFAMADRGIDPVPETQGIVTSTSANVVGNFASATEIQWRITDNTAGLSKVPPLVAPAAIYESTYTEDTQSHGVGLMLYDKEMDVETSGQISGQWNIEATKQIAFIGIDGAYVVSTDNIMVDGAAMNRVTELVTDVPSVGFASAYMDVLIQEAGAGNANATLLERIEFHEETSVDGVITLFDKLMHYESGMVR